VLCYIGKFLFSLEILIAIYGIAMSFNLIYSIMRQRSFLYSLHSGFKITEETGLQVLPLSIGVLFHTFRSLPYIVIEATSYANK
jgi:hypothetical protein